MGKTKSELSIKNSILIFVSALALVAASFCWFSMSSQNNIEQMSVGVDTLSSDFVFYEAVDTNRDGVISGQETYVEISNASINTSNMVPGQTFFYKAIVRNKKAGANFAFIFKNILDSNNLSGQVIVTARLLDSNSTVRTATSGVVTIHDIAVTDENDETNAPVLSDTNLPIGYYELYYTLKLNSGTTSTYEGKSMTISDVMVAFYE